MLYQLSYCPILVEEIGVEPMTDNPMSSAHRESSQKATRSCNHPQMRFHYAISFAGAQRETARELAHALGAVGLNIFFDEHFEHEMLGKDGADYLNTIFFREAASCIALISKEYDESAWTRLERQAAQAREHQNGTGTLIPVLIDGYKPDWMLPTKVYFNLQKRDLSGLVRTLVKKAVSENELFTLTCTIEEVVPEGPLQIIAADSVSEFLLRCTWAKAQPSTVLRVSPGKGPDWIVEPLIPKLNADRFLAANDLLVSISQPWDKQIGIHSRVTGQCQYYWPSRNSEWNSITDSKIKGHILALGFCGGDIFTFDLMSRTFQCIQQGTPKADHATLDFVGDDLLFGTESSHALSLYSFKEKQIVRTCPVDGYIGRVLAFPKIDRTVVIGQDDVRFYSWTDWKLLSSIEVWYTGLFEPSKSESASMFAVINGMPMARTDVLVYAVPTAQQVFRQQSPKRATFDSIALSGDGKSLAALQGETLLIFTKA